MSVKAETPSVLMKLLNISTCSRGPVDTPVDTCRTRALPLLIQAVLSGCACSACLLWFLLCAVLNSERLFTFPQRVLLWGPGAEDQHLGPPPRFPYREPKQVLSSWCWCSLFFVIAPPFIKFKNPTLPQGSYFEKTLRDFTINPFWKIPFS